MRLLVLSIALFVSGPLNGGSKDKWQLISENGQVTVWKKEVDHSNLIAFTAFIIFKVPDDFYFLMITIN